MKRKVKRIERSLLSVWGEIARSVLSKVESRKLFVNLGDSSTNFTESECIRAFSESVEESPVRNMLLNCLISSELKCPGSSYVALSLLADDFEPELNHGGRFNLDIVQASLKQLIGEDASDVVVKAIKISGRKGKIVIQNSSLQLTEISYGSQICKWKPDPSYFSSINQQKVSVENCKVVFIDGIIESVSECHRLFQSSHESRVPIVIFARGFAEEIVATAAINMQRQTAQIIPVVIPFDEIGVNGMADLATCFSSEVISSDKGQLISNIDVESCMIANRITCSYLGTEIEYRSNRVNDVVKNLTSRLNKEDDLKSDLIRRRLEYLGSGAVTIKVGNEKKALRNIHHDRIDFGVRYIRACMLYGVVKFKNKFLPAESIASGLRCVKSFRKLLQNSKIVLEVDNVVRPAR